MPLLPDRKKPSLATLNIVLVLAINMGVESIHLASNDIEPIYGTTWVRSLKENSQVKNSHIDRIKHILGKKVKEEIVKKKFSPVRVLRNLLTRK